MSDNNKPDENINGPNINDDEDIIDLTEVAPDTPEGPGDDDDVIDLTETVTGDDEILDLTDVAPDVEPESVDDEDVLELTDVASGDQDGDDEVIDLVDSLDDDDDVIELTDVEEDIAVQDEVPADEPISLAEEVDAPAMEEVAGDMPAAVEEKEEDVDKELLELIESINDDDLSGSGIEDIGGDAEDQAESEEDLLEPDEEIDIPGEDHGASESEEKKVFAESLDEDLGSVLTYSGDVDAAEEGEKILDRPGVVSVKVQDLRDDGKPVDFKFESKLQPGDKIFREKDYNKAITQATTEQVEEAVRKVIKEMLADKIDDLITDVIEKKVLQEIDRIKNLLLDDAESRN